MPLNLDDIHGYAIAPIYIFRSKLTKDEKIIAPVLSACMDSEGWWKYDIEKLAYLAGMSENEAQKAVERLERRDILEFDTAGNISIEWARSPDGWMK